MPIWLTTIIWHNLKRFAGVIIITVVLIGGPYLLYRYGYNKGYKTGYSQSVKDRPTYGTVGTVVNNYEKAYKHLGIKINLWKFYINFGI